MRSLRVRVVAVSTLVLVVVLAAAGWWIVELVDRQLRAELRQQSTATLDDLQRRIADGEDPATIVMPLATDGTEFVISDDNDEWVNSTVTVQVFDESSGPVGPPEGPLGEGVPVAFQQEDGSFVVIPDDIRYATTTVEACAPDGGCYRLDALTPNVLVERAVGQVRAVLWVVIPALALVFAGLVWLLTTRLLRPVDVVRARAERITSRTLDERIPEPGTDDEIHRLVTTLNGMLDRLDRGAQAQRAFVSDASHELRSPLTVLLGEAELATASDDPERWRAANVRAVEHGRRMETLIDDLLDLARTDETTLRRTELDLDDVVQRAAADHRHRVSTTDVEPVRLWGDPGGLDRLFRNLIDNAVRHGNDRVVVTCRSDGDDAVVTVDDDGPGIPPDGRRLVFERFARLDESRARATGGSGLGLAIVQAVAVAHQGSVTVDDAPLGGARFTVRLPRTMPDGPDEPPTTA
ncbi:MAG: HAMP domain-containing sensor histidine kinase [Actinomycetota bacterium]